MNQTNQWAKQAQKHIRVLSKSIGPRGATSKEERRAAEYVREELHRLGLRDVRLEPFLGAVSAWLPWAIAFSIATWGTFVGLLFGLVGSIFAAVLYLIATWIVYRELYPSIGGRSVRRWLWQADSQNALGVAPPAGPVERRAVLMSYLDSARTPFLWRTQERRRLGNLLMWPLFLSLPFSAIVLLLGAITSNVVFYFVALALSFPQIAVLIASLYAEHSPFSPGTNNNASGVGTLLALAERLRKTPLARTEVWILATGCRETGGDGARTFLKTHGQSLTDATFVAVEGVGVGQRVVYLNGEGVLRRTPYLPRLLTLAEQAAERCREQGLEVQVERHRGGPTEMGLIARGGFEGVTINVWPDDWSGVAGRRRMNDTPDTIQTAALTQSHTFAWTLLQEIDAAVEYPRQ